MRYLTVLVLVLASAVWSVQSARKKGSPDFSRYAQTEAFRQYLSAHTDTGRDPHHIKLVAITAFPAGDDFALQYFVSASGKENDCRDVYNWAIQATHNKQLSKADVSSLRVALHDLPAASASPPLERLVVISFYKGRNWVTRSYDSAALPHPMRRIYDIIGERFESKPKQRHDGAAAR